MRFLSDQDVLAQVSSAAGQRPKEQQEVQLEIKRRCQKLSHVGSYPDFLQQLTDDVQSRDSRRRGERNRRDAFS